MVVGLHRLYRALRPVTDLAGNGLDLRGLSKSYGLSPAVIGLDLSLQAGELVTLLGPSGCGKSTTLRLIAGLETPDSGTIAIGGADMSRLAVPDRQVGLVFQRYALFQHMSVRRNIGFGLDMRGVPATEAARRVDEIIAVVGLDGLEHRFPHQLSGGQMQRVALARTLVTRPRLLMLDEPFAALDADLRARLRSFLRGLQQELGLTTLFVTHDQAEAMELSDRIAVMQAGRLLQFDTPEAIYNRPASPAVARMFGAPNLLEARATPDGQLVHEAFGLQFAAGPAVPAGETVTIMLRPEALRLLPADSPVLVTGLLYLGKTVLYTLRAADQELRVERPSAEPRFALGQTVALDCDSDAVWQFPASISPSSP
jgi:putative spermidine/putrescine transport system ATP-binding protein